MTIGIGNGELEFTLRGGRPSSDPASRNAVERMKSDLGEPFELQTTVIETTKPASQGLFGCIASEGLLMVKFAMRLPAIRSIPEAPYAYHDLSIRRLEMAFEDATNFWAEMQKLMHAAQLGWMRSLGEGPGAVNS